MLLITTLRRLLVQNFVDAKLRTLATLVAVYFFASWLVLRLSGETELTGGPEFIYWMLVTASTVGYGDLSPTTTPGRWFVALFVIPFGLGLFAFTIGRLAAFVSDQWKKGLRGLKTLDCSNHIVVLGWNGQRTLYLLKLLLRENQQTEAPSNIVLCVTDEIDNPLPDLINFVHTPTFADDEGLDRACLASARSIIIDILDDNTTLTAALYCNARNPTAHLIAYFRDDSLAGLLKQHCPTIECTPSVAVELLAKSAFDPGSSALHRDLLSVEHGQSQYSMRYPGPKPTTVDRLFSNLKKGYQATLIGIQPGPDAPIELNPGLDQPVAADCTVYYIAQSRIITIDWSTIV